MSDTEYALVQQQLVLLAGLVAEIDLDGFLARISRAEAVGPILDPTLWMKASSKLDAVKALAESLVPFQREITQQRKELRR